MPFRSWMIPIKKLGSFELDHWINSMHQALNASYLHKFIKTMKKSIKFPKKFFRKF